MELASSCAVAEDSAVTDVGTSKDYVVVADDYGQIHVLSTGGAHLRTINDQSGAVRAVALVGETVLSGGSDGCLRAWNLVSGARIYTVLGHESAIRCLAATFPVFKEDSHSLAVPDSSSIDSSTTTLPGLAVAGSSDGSLRVHNIQEGSCVRVLSGHSGPITTLAIHNNTLISGSYDATARIWSLDTGECSFVLQDDMEGVLQVLIDDRKAYTVTADGSIRVWDRSNGLLLARLSKHGGRITNICVHSNTLISSGVDGTLGVWSLESYKWLRGVQTHDHAVTAFGVYDGIAFSGGKDGGDADDACGLNARTMMWPLNQQAENPDIKQLGTLAQAVWKVKIAGERLIIVAAKRGKVTIEFWKKKS